MSKYKQGPYRCHTCGRLWKDPKTYSPSHDICDECAEQLERAYAQREQDENEYWERRHRERIEQEDRDTERMHRHHMEVQEHAGF